ncbi:MAG: hypothetical protein WKG07_05225 [Hymenobacter sp.]
MGYFNNPELNGKYLGTIPTDFATAPTPAKQPNHAKTARLRRAH